VAAVVEAVEHAAHDLALLAQVLVRLERERFTSPRLAELRASLDQHGEAPSVRLHRLKRLVELLDSRDHVLLRTLEPVILYTTGLAYAADQWRRQSGPAVRRWIEAVGEIEALSSLAGYAYEHPADPFPEIAGGPALFDAEDLAHPLIPEERVVRNHLLLGGDGPRLLIVSGSNMSGKSTLLRAVGVNAVLALAGAPVHARRLRLSPLSVGASIRVLDSLRGGTSRFYAEITRVRRIVELTGGAAPVLFLLDEFLHGTNSHDRRVGAEATARGLLARGAIGLVTTHDLALTAIAGAPGTRAANVHFEDRFENGRISFDYRLRPGVVEHSNALELMRSVGLEV
jgi:DNA mismatch repair ATPase MutS